jgi:zinc transport system ATP-binding protein
VATDNRSAKNSDSRTIEEPPVVVVENLDFAWQNGVEVLRNVNLVVPRGVFLGVIGPNGGGKTTFLRLILGELAPTHGQVTVFGTPATRLGNKRAAIGYMQQRCEIDRSFPATAIEVVLMGLFARIGLGRRVGRWARERAMTMLERTGMAEYANRPISKLSVGQQQRVLMARALVSEPQLLLLDEPTASVDTGGQEAFLEMLAQLRREMRLTIIMVTHDLLNIGHYADRLACLCRTIHWHQRSDEVTEDEIRDAVTCELDDFLAYGRRLAKGVESGDHSTHHTDKSSEGH